MLRYIWLASYRAFGVVWVRRVPVKDLGLVGKTCCVSYEFLLKV